MSFLRRVCMPVMLSASRCIHTGSASPSSARTAAVPCWEWLSRLSPLRDQELLDRAPILCIGRNFDLKLPGVSATASSLLEVRHVAAAGSGRPEWKPDRADQPCGLHPTLGQDGARCGGSPSSSGEVWPRPHRPLLPTLGQAYARQHGRLDAAVAGVSLAVSTWASRHGAGPNWQSGGGASCISSLSA